MGRGQRDTSGVLLSYGQFEVGRGSPAGEVSLTEPLGHMCTLEEPHNVWAVAFLEESIWLLNSPSTGVGGWRIVAVVGLSTGRRKDPSPGPCGISSLAALPAAGCAEMTDLHLYRHVSGK